MTACSKQQKMLIEKSINQRLDGYSSKALSPGYPYMANGRVRLLVIQGFEVCPTSANAL